MTIENGDKGYTGYRHAVWCKLSPEQEVSDSQMIQSLIDFVFERSAKEDKEIAQVFIISDTRSLVGLDPKRVWAVQFFLRDNNGDI